MQQNGLCLVEGHILCIFILYDILAKVKFRDRQQFSHCQEQSMKEGVEYKGAQAEFQRMLELY